MKLPCYPLITIDPMMSIWSKSERLYDDDTILWCGIRKRVSAVVTIDGKDYRFMGLGEQPVIEQTAVEVTPLVTIYTFENEKIRLEVKFWTPLFTDNLYELSMPCSFIECSSTSKDGDSHRVIVKISLDKELCYDRAPKPINRKIVRQNNIDYAVMGRKYQRPIYKSGDGVSADWGQVCLYSDDVSADFMGENGISASAVAESRALFIFAYDDIKSLEYMGKRYKGLWSERFYNIGNVIKYAYDNYDMLYSKALEWNDRILNDSEDFGEDYQFVLTAAYRQMLAAHKLVRNDKGELLYFSKECHSNGCINTVDVSYPAIPFFLTYKPELIEGMMTGIFEFASLPVWKYDFAPHDIGTYPIANGQAYGLQRQFEPLKKALYKLDNENVYNFRYQMPVEECGNMLVMAYTHCIYTGNTAVVEKNYDLLAKWADYLVGVGVVLENQLCTDDFAGHSEKNINLAIKSIMGIASFSRISALLGIENEYMSTAREYAKKLSQNILPDGTLPFSVGNEESWSLKYNLVWDMLLDFNLFDKELYKAESEKYRGRLDTFGVPLDYRKSITKTDWMMWAAVLDESGENIKLFARAIRNYLENTDDIVCFSDYINTDIAKYCSFNHRSVQAGLWMPVLVHKLKK